MTNEKTQAVLVQARLLINGGKLEEAGQLLKDSIGKEARNEGAFNLLGAVYEKSDNLEGACLMYRVAITINSAYQPAQFNLHRLAKYPSDLNGIDLGV